MLAHFKNSRIIKNIAYYTKRCCLKNSTNNLELIHSVKNKDMKHNEGECKIQHLTEIKLTLTVSVYDTDGKWH